MSRISPTSSANTRFPPVQQRNKESQRSAGPVLCFPRRGYAAFPFSFPPKPGAMERREAPGVGETPYGPCEGPFRAPYRAGLRGLPWDARPLGEGAAPAGAPPAEPGLFARSRPPKGLGLISDPTLRPAPPASRLMRTAGSETWLRVGISSCRNKVKVRERHCGIERLACLKGT